MSLAPKNWATFNF
uniref:Uncharacterized protein n=1 Tax=Rhizophora mucronata TaxID=61149 RepID=A0A2P2NAX6_RHIMU